MTDRTVIRVCMDCGAKCAVSVHASSFKRCPECSDAYRRKIENERGRLVRVGVQPKTTGKTKTINCVVCGVEVVVRASATTAKYCPLHAYMARRYRARGRHPAEERSNASGKYRETDGVVRFIDVTDEELSRERTTAYGGPAW